MANKPNNWYALTYEERRAWEKQDLERQDLEYERDKEREARERSDRENKRRKEEFRNEMESAQEQREAMRREIDDLEYEVEERVEFLKAKGLEKEFEEWAKSRRG